jgi:competence protein ComEC
MGGGQHTGGRLAALALAWLAGVGVQLNERALWPVEVHAALLAAGMLCTAIAAWRPRFFVLALAGLLAAGLGATGLRADLLLRDALAAELEGVDLDVTGVVASLPQRGGTGLRFRFDVESARLRDQPVAVPARVSLGWFIGFHDDAALTPQQQSLAAGQRWRFAVRLRRPHGHLNPHGFDHELHLFEQGVRATGTVRDTPARLLAPAAGHPVERLRQRVRDAIEAHVDDRRAAGVLAALSIGDQGAIDREDWELFRHTGVAHLVSISGLHITMFAWGASLLIAAAWRRVAPLSTWVPAPQAGRWGGLAAAAAYALCSGWGVPAQRTVWMLAVATWLHGGGRHWPWPLVLLAAAVVVTALDPWALLQPGFWLSFAAVGLLMASSPAHEAALPAADGDRWTARRAAASRSLRAALRSQIIATLGLTPLTLVFFQQVSMVGFIANLLAIPVVTLLVTPLALLGALFAPLWWLAALVVRGLCTALGGLADVPGAVWSVPAAPPWAQAAGLAGAVLLILPLPWRLRLLALPLALPLLMPVVARPEAGRFDVLAVDVGQGTAVLVRTRGHVLLYDTGPQYSRDSDAGQRVLLPLLRARGDWPLDLLMLSHRDADHVGGARALLGAGAAATLSGSLEDGHPLRALASSSGRCEAGQAWQWDGVRFEVLHPPASAYGGGWKSNGMSCVLRVWGPQGSMLLAGDIERAQEAALVVANPGALRSDVLIVPHHGSKTSSTAAFLDAVQPSVAIVQSGYRNRFGHPAQEIVDRYVARGIVVRDSPGCGAWQWPGDRQGQGVCQRDVARRYWHHVPQRPPD